MIIEDRSHVKIEKENGVMTLTINWPEEHNAMDWQTHEGIAKAYRMAECDEDVKVLVVKGTEGYFNTGGKCNNNDPGEKEKYNRKKQLQQEKRERIIYSIVGSVAAVALVTWIGFSVYARVEANRPVSYTEVNVSAVSDYLSTLN